MFELPAQAQRSVCVGYSELTLIDSASFEQSMEGYAYLEGTDLTGTADGDWKTSWQIIGSDSLGDPLFIDRVHEDLPVYTAAHGTGIWSPTIIASTYEGFLKAIDSVAEIANGRDNPVAMQGKPIFNSEAIAFLRNVKKMIGKGELGGGSFCWIWKTVRLAAGS